MSAPTETRGVGIASGGTVALRDVDFAIRPGEIVSVVGPDESGKTTLPRLLIGALRPDVGRVIRRVAPTLGYVRQKLSFDAAMPLTADRFSCLGRRARRLRARPDVGAGWRRPPRASADGGSVGRAVARALLARTLLRRPDLAALDEPTQGLHQIAAAGFYKLIEAVRAETGCAVLMVSHDTPQRACVLRGHAHRRLRRAGMARAVRDGDGDGRNARAASP